ncbi:MAG TPA: hypothetical protein DD384_00280, partial [Firmicutes bacterium]|nr:hypothetical protein [Bacillota bacterium]
ALAFLSRKRQSNDIEVASLIGNDIQMAYNFNQIGLLAIDESGLVLWSNSLFNERQLDLVDTDIFQTFPALKELVKLKSDKAVHLDMKGKSYEVRFLSEPRLFVFKDVTEYDNVVNYSKEQAIALGVVMIDNFNDVASDTDEVADAVMNVRAILRDYFRQYKVLLTQVKQDRYFAVCNFNALDQMEKDGFSVMDKVREKQDKEDTPLTLSIGFAHDFPDVGKLYEMTEEAIDTALARGGDQAVVSQYGKELRFFGGKSAAIENTSKVKVRSMVGGLAKLIKDSSAVFIMGHTEMDMDALGSCLGVKAICDWCKKPAKIIYSPKRTEKKARLAFTSAFSKDALDQLTVTPEQAASQIKETSLVVVVDVSVPRNVMAPKILDLARKVVVIDHHRRGDSFIERPSLSYIEPSASSACELITEMIRYAAANPRIDLKPSYATIMLSGIFMDSQYFKSKSVGMRTFEAAEILKEYGAENTLADEYLKDDYEEFALTNKILGTMKTPSYGVLYCVSEDNDIVERSALAKVANSLLSLRDVHASFVIGRTADKQISISARSDGTVSVQLLMEQLGGGGHLTMAATLFPNPKVPNVTHVDEAEKKLLECLNDYLDASKVNVTAGGNNV